MNQQALGNLSTQMSHLNEQQKMIHIAMFMDPKMIPETPKSGNVEELSQTIKKLFKEKKLTHLSLDKNGNIQCY
jgi:hypothetical protein